MSTTIGHRLLITLGAGLTAVSLDINGRPVEGVRRWALVDEGGSCRLEVECYWRDDQGRRIPKRDAGGNIIRPTVVQVDADGQPVLLHGHPALIEGEPIWETQRLTATLRRSAIVVLEGEVPLTGPNLDLCEELIARSVDPPPDHVSDDDWLR